MAPKVWGSWRKPTAQPPVNAIWRTYDTYQRRSINQLWNVCHEASRGELTKAHDVCALILLRSLDPLEDE